MNIRTHFKVGLLDAASVGDLVKITSGPNGDDIDLGFIFQKDEDFCHLIVLKSTSDSGYAPYVDKFRLDTPCVNYGSEWILEPVETFTNKTRELQHPGQLGFTDRHTILQLGPQKQGATSHSLKFDFIASSFHRGSVHDAYVMNALKIWVSDNHRSETNAEPLAVVESTPIKAR